MEKYLIAFDLDGTLLTDDKRITECSKQYIEKLKKDGHIVCIATGRPYNGMSNYYKELNLNTPIINTNGGMVHNPCDKNFKTEFRGIEVEVTKKVFREIDDYILDAYFSYGTDVYYTSLHKTLQIFINIEETTKVTQGKIYDIADVETSGVIVLVKPDRAEEFENHISKNYDQLSVRLFHKEEESWIYELYQKSISKAVGLEIVLNHYNMTPKNLIAFGDGNNDLEMLEYANIGVAMVNGKQEAIDCAKYITREDNNNDGPILFLDHFLNYNTLK